MKIIVKREDGNEEKFEARALNGATAVYMGDANLDYAIDCKDKTVVIPKMSVVKITIEW